jgi:gamma-glutamylcyclotransferase (GGCT)/AIG2-like uncharacterized protein YtfP
VSCLARNKAARSAWTLALLLAHFPLAALAADPQPREYLDPETAATVTIVGEPIVFANARTEVAANARDYVTVAAAAVDRNGKVSYVLVAYFWSTVDSRVRGYPMPNPEPLVVQADDRRIELTLRGHKLYDSGISVPVHTPPGPAVTPNVYSIDLGALRSIAESRQLSLITETSVTSIPYGLWEDHRAALRAFVQRMSSGR